MWYAVSGNRKVKLGMCVFVCSCVFYAVYTIFYPLKFDFYIEIISIFFDTHNNYTLLNLKYCSQGVNQ